MLAGSDDLLSSADIDEPAHGLEMISPDTQPHPAQMVNLKALRD
jgi:hypothetical protein